MEYWSNIAQTPSMVLQGDSLGVLRTLPSGFVQCIVTSPPYWGLRDYGTSHVVWQSEQELCERHRWDEKNFCVQCGAWRGELGSEPTPGLYVSHLVLIFSEAYRILKPDGTLWLNLGDTYAGSGQSWGQKPRDVSPLQKSNKGSLLFLKKPPVNYRVPGLKPKDLVGIPWSVAFALRDEGWYLRRDNIWYKPNAMTESMKDRPTTAHEYIFLLTKKRRYYYDADAIREPHKESSLQRTKRPWKGNRDVGAIKPSYTGMKSENMCHPKGRNKRSVWIITTKGYRGAHFATFPEDIPEICLKAGSRVHDVVMDPFAGAGTTLRVALRLGRRPIGIELKQRYITSHIIPRLQSEEIKETMHKLFGYPGGKWPIRNLVVFCFPKHTTYVDVFGGSAAILLTKEKSDGEVFNDKNELIANFFRVVKHRPAELAERAQHWIHSRTLWNELKLMATPVDEIERAFRFWAMLADSFGSKGAHFGMAREGARSVTSARAYLDEVAKRIEKSHIENLEFAKCIKNYDAPETFFYCDPPYRGTTGGNTNYNLLSDDEWRQLRDSLASVKGKFLLSSNNDRFVRKLFKGFYIREIDVRVTLPRAKKNGTRKELLISNYKITGLNKRNKTERRTIVYGPNRPAAHKSAQRIVRTVKAHIKVLK